MTSPMRSVAVRLSLDPTSYISGVTRAERSTLSLDKAVAGVGPHAGTSMEKAAAGAGKAEGALGRLNKASGALGFSLGGLAGASAAVAVGMSVKWAGDYQSALTRLNTTAGESQKNLGMIGKGMLDMAGQVGIGADELAKGMYTIDSAGIHGADSLTVLKAAAQGAKQEQADLSHVVDAVTTSLHDYHLPASQAATVTSQLIAAVSHGKTTFDELTGAMHSVEPIAASAGMSIAQTAGALAAMTASGMHADQAAQNLASSIRSFEKPTGTMRDELYQLGLDAQDLSAHLGERGIAGTLQMVSDAIVRKMGPAGQVALDALNKNKAAANDLVVMMHTMPPALAKASAGLLDGTVSIKDYRTAAKDMGGTQAAMALQFLSLYSSSKGFSNILKSGGPAVQTYIGALGKAVGTSEGLSVALQLTGENAASTNKTIAAVGKASASASGDIHGWDEVQKNFNQRLAEAEQGLKSLAIEAGQHLLPALGDVFGVVSKDVVPGIEHMGSAAGDAIHWFSQLPAPVKDTALAFAGLKLAMGMNFLGLSSGLTAVKTSAAGLSAEMASQRALYAEEAAGAQMYAAALGELDAAQVLAAAGSTRVSAGSMLASKSMAGLKSAGSGLLSFFGGPWGVGLIAAGAGIFAIKNAIDQHNASVKADTQQVSSWYKAMTAGGQPAVTALDDLKKKQNDLSVAQAKLNDLEHQSTNSMLSRSKAGAALNGEIRAQKDKVAELSGELTKGEKDWEKYWKSLSPQEKVAQNLAGDEANLALAIQQHGAASHQAQMYAGQYNLDLERQKELTGQVAAAEQTQIDKLNTLANLQLGAVSSALAATQSQSQLNTAISQYNKDAKDGQHSTSALADESSALASQAIDTARAVAKQAVDQAAANGKTDDGTLANATMLKSLQEAAKHITGPGHDALMQAINDLQHTTIAHGDVGDAAKKMGLHVEATWDHNTRVVSGATAQQIADLQNLGFKVTHLPGGKIVVSTDTGPARKELDRLIAIYKGTTLTLAGNYHVAGLNGQPGGTQTKADGGPIIGPGTGTSDTAGLYALSNGEHVWTAAETHAAGGHTGVAALRKAVLAAGRGRAAGGPVGQFDMYDTMTAHLSASAIQQAEASIRALAAQAAAVGPSGAGGAARWLPVVLQSLSMMGQSPGLAGSVLRRMNQESGGNPSIVNRWDSNWLRGTPSVGLMQVIGPTYRANADPRRNVGPYLYGTSIDPLSNLLAAEQYALSRYGSLTAAFNRAGGYANGGTTPAGAPFWVGESGPELMWSNREQYVTSAVKSREVAGGSMGGGAVVHKTDARSYPLTVQTGPNVTSIVKGIRDSQYQQDFLYG